MSSIQVGTLGVMVCRREGTPPFTDREYLKNLCLASSRLGLRVFVFFPDHIKTGNDGIPESSVTGLIYRQGRWEEDTFPFPDLIYDRCLSKNASESLAVRHALTAAAVSSRILWSRGLPGKQKVYEHLQRNPSLLPHLPHTLTYTGTASLRKALQCFRGELFMKPSSGSHGSHTLYVNTTGEKPWVQGRKRDNSMFRLILHDKDLFPWIQRFTGQRTFLIQPFLQLTCKDGSPFDIRVLVQKNETGRWNITGSALRKGSPDGLTSNLHGGGSAVPVLPFLQSQFGLPVSAEITDLIEHLSAQIPPLLENGFGRLGELGIDFGVDRMGKVWLLEVNSKPGRQAFTHTRDIPAAKLSVMNPLRYARYLLLRQLRRVIS
ncbi:YheC/YheD family protein [Paenibacillus lemnae]|uniref:YheC/YheD family protein n=1 Tax=Paenibacillus lemnae TaxID=1330551 RepID=A0A848M5H6_PAELE|nr:YheC/YheD family protein [Paenibacillus lemnae]NMO95509.1 YheC/YheD family protein [Paenibacillus lemnae]